MCAEVQVCQRQIVVLINRGIEQGTWQQKDHLSSRQPSMYLLQTARVINDAIPYLKITCHQLCEARCFEIVRTEPGCPTKIRKARVERRHGTHPRVHDTGHVGLGYSTYSTVHQNATVQSVAELWLLCRRVFSIYPHTR